MTTTASKPERIAFFQQLKTWCVPLSKLAIRSAADQSGASNSTAKDILFLLQSLTSAWDAQAAANPSVLDVQLADYVFFPLTHLLRGASNEARHPIRVVEATVSLLRRLIRHGWKARIPHDLAHQLLIFLTLVVEGAPLSSPSFPASSSVPEEMLVEGLMTLSTLVASAGSSAAVASSLFLPPKTAIDDNDQGGAANAWGHTVSVLLERISDVATPNVQVEAMGCLRVLFERLCNELLAKMLPGTVSALSRLLSSPLSSKVPRRVLRAGLEALQTVLTGVLGDIKTRGIAKQTDDQKDGSVEKRLVGGPKPGAEVQDVLSPSWLRATTAQVKIALSSVLKLRNHEAGEMRAAVGRFCVSLLDECHSSLANCRSILVESALVVDEDAKQPVQEGTSLQDLACIYPELGDDIKMAMYGWYISLPRIMQASDERLKQRVIRSIVHGNRLVADLRLDSTVLDNAIGHSLRDSIIGMLLSSKPAKVVDDVGTQNTIWARSDLVSCATNKTVQTEYQPVLFVQESQKTTRSAILALLSSIGSADPEARRAADMLGHVRGSDGLDQLAAYWLCFELLKANFAHTADMDRFMVPASTDEPHGPEAVFGELFNFSVSVLAAHSDAVADHERLMDWRVEAVALEVTAAAAARMGEDFRPELVDVLYPIATFLGTARLHLRSHAVATLNCVAAACGYAGGVAELVVDNADYMVNTAALRLNTFDACPAETRVLAMLVRLTGPRLVPYLDDVVAAIFAALDNYHGYPAFVEALFCVLGEVVRQAARSDALLPVQNAKSPTPTTVHHAKKAPQASGIGPALRYLRQRSELRAKRNKDHEEVHDGTNLGLGHPRQPWGPAKARPDNKPPCFLDTLQAMEASAKEDDDQHQAVDAPKPQITPTYTLLVRIAALTQHHLTSPSPTLRKCLLDLVAVACPALAPDEDAFLPVVNELWPVLLARLRDPEPFVRVAACGALARLCEAAGDFLATRFKTEWWDGERGGLANWFARAKNKARGGPRGYEARLKNKWTASSPAAASRAGVGGHILIPGRSSLSSLVLAAASARLGSDMDRFAQPMQVWRAALELLAALIGHVRVDDHLYDNVLDMVADDIFAAPLLPQNDVRHRLRQALENVNADAVWLAAVERRHNSASPSPESLQTPEHVDGVRFLSLDDALALTTNKMLEASV